MKTKTEKPRVVQLTDNVTANVVVGGQINLSIADARALYNLTSMSRDETEWAFKLQTSRDILRNMAKAILLTKGEETPVEEIIESFSSNEMKLPVIGLHSQVKTSTIEAFSAEDLEERLV